MRVRLGVVLGSIVLLTLALSGPCAPELRAQARARASRFDLAGASRVSSPGSSGRVEAAPLPVERSTRRGAMIGAIAGSAAGAVGGTFIGLVAAGLCESGCPTHPAWFAAGMGLGGAIVGAAAGAAAGAIVGAAIPRPDGRPAPAPVAHRRRSIGRLSVSAGAALDSRREGGPAASANFEAALRRLFVGFEGGTYGFGEHPACASPRPGGSVYCSDTVRLAQHAWNAGAVARAELVGGRVRGYVVAGSGYYSWKFSWTSIELLGYSVGLGVHGPLTRHVGFRVEGRRHDNLSRGGSDVDFRTLAAGLTYSW